MVSLYGDGLTQRG